jgi:hypothetical protein
VNGRGGRGDHFGGVRVQGGLPSTQLRQAGGGGVVAARIEPVQVLPEGCHRP